MSKAKFPPAVHHHKASGQDRCRVKGRDIYLGKHGSPEAMAAYARLVAELAAGGEPAARSEKTALSISAVVAAWWSEAGKRFGPESDQARKYRNALRPLLRLYGPTPAADFKADQLETLRTAKASGSWMNYDERRLAAGPKGNKPVGLCAEVANRSCGYVKTVFRWAERKGHVPEGRWAHLCALPGLAANDASVRHSGGRKACTWEELSLVAARCLRPVRAMLLLQWHTGMRSGEVRIMRPCDVDRTGEVWVYRPRSHKNAWRGQSRAVALGPACREILASFLADCESDQHLFRPARRRCRDHYQPTTYAQAVRRASLEAGVPDFSPYQARHAFKQRVAREMGLEHARGAMGHKNIGSTAHYASEVDLTAAIEVAKRMS